MEELGSQPSNGSPAERSPTGNKTVNGRETHRDFFGPRLFSLSSRTRHREVAYRRSVDELPAARNSTTSAGGLSEPL